ncbi:hypothetical protein BBOV_III011420 [Babesia bovis T2Bo]|uniref:hypothetical protein n=1 Tax=Babesia bovis T2Bo TaxID=484906 RepID=UPI001C36A694|nr:hypothetical protein BBOV_III011420 [Babesia bovis T2Bo]EDO08694.2 hypothetical protein BBOV_III011420 [Babesia bovis T2Bo]
MHFLEYIHSFMTMDYGSILSSRNADDTNEAATAAAAYPSPNDSASSVSREESDMDDVNASSSEDDVGTVRSFHSDTQDAGEEYDEMNSGLYDTRQLTEINTDSYQINVDNKAAATVIKQDGHNLYYSHMPRILGTDFRFQIGELAYVRWHGELNLVVIQFASQKLITVEPPSDEGQADSDTKPRSSHKKSSDTPKSQLHCDEEAEMGGSSSDLGESTATESKCSPKPAKRKSSTKRQSKSKKCDLDTNMKIFSDPHSEALYKHNRLQPVPFRVDDQVPPDAPAYDNATDADEDIYSYFVPIYFVSFPGYKKKCAKNFRFWVKEKDLMKYDAVERCNRPLGGSDESPEWLQRKVQDINEYVYNMAFNMYLDSPGIENMFPGLIKQPWCVPRALISLVNDHVVQVMTAGTVDVDIYSISAVEMFTMSPIMERLSAYGLVQNFKYILFKMATLFKKQATAPVSKPKPTVRRATGLKDVRVDEVNVPSLRLLEHLESETLAKITSQQFQEIYLNNIYWLDIFLSYMDKEFIHTHCHNEQEHEFLYMLINSKDLRPCKILGIEYLARMFCFPVMYRDLLKHLERDGEHYPIYRPITQLLLQYMAFVAADYAHNQKYMPSHLEGGLIKLTQMNAV